MTFFRSGAQRAPNRKGLHRVQTRMRPKFQKVPPQRNFLAYLYKKAGICPAFYDILPRAAEYLFDQRCGAKRRITV